MHFLTLGAISYRVQVASLPWTDFCKLWKDYMVVMAECLVEAAGDVASRPGQRLAHLVYETGASNLLERD